MKQIRVCDVVRNSIWYDPRVIKQIDEYYNNGFDTYAVGVEDNRFNEDDIKRIKGSVRLVKLKNLFKKRRNKLITLLQELYVYKSLITEIIKCKPDIIHANDLNALLPAYFASKKLKCKIIYDSHEIFTENSGIATSYIKHTFWKIVERNLIQKVDLVISVSNAAADYLSNLYNIPKPMVITNCSKRQIEEEHIKSEKFEILNHGKFYEGRGYEMMIEAAEITSNKDISYVLRGYGKLEDQLKKNVTDKKISNVRFDQPVKTHELISYAKKSHVGIAITLPININFKLTVSNKIFEYLAAGLPVIMSDVPEHRYLNEKYNFGIILKENTAEALKEAVMILYENKKLYDMYSTNAKATASELNWENEFKKLIDFEKGII